MMAIGSYFAYIIFVMGTMSVAQDINEEQEKNFIENILAAHNYFRKRHGSDPLELDQDLCKKANECVYKKRSAISCCTLYPEYEVNWSMTDMSKNDDGTFKLDPLGIVSDWYNKGNIHDTTSLEDIDAFTQIVWKSTAKIGVGISVKDKKCYVAVLYFPPGNQSGQYEANVNT